jgi:hypothetical protein
MMNVAPPTDPEWNRMGVRLLMFCLILCAAVFFWSCYLWEHNGWRCELLAQWTVMSACAGTVLGTLLLSWSFATRVGPPRTIALVSIMFPLAAATIQSVCVFGNRPKREYQALLHPDNYNPLWLILIVEMMITTCALWPLRKTLLSIPVAALLLLSYVVYAFSINHAAIR